MTKEIETVNTSTGEVAAITDMDHWHLMRQQAETLVKSGFLPVAINTPEKALAIMQKAKELGIPPMEGLSSISIIQGKPSVSPQLMLGLARRTKELEDIEMKSDEKGATVTIKRKGQTAYTTHFGVKEATDMGLIGKDNWKKQFSVMAQWRALAANLRITFPDAIAGIYTSDELTDGEMTVTTRGPVQMPKAIEG